MKNTDPAEIVGHVSKYDPKMNIGKVCLMVKYK